MFWAAIIKDTQLLLRDRGALLSLFLLPLIFVAVFGNLFGTGIRDGGKPRSLAVYHPADAPQAAEVVRRIGASGVFHVEPQASPEAVRAWVAAEKSRVGLIVPAGFDPGRGVPAEFVVDTAAPIRFRGPIEGALRGLMLSATGHDPRVLAGLLVAKSPPGVKPPLDEVSGFQVSVPGNAVLFGFFMALTMALSFVEERKSGTWRRLLAAPVSRPALLLAKLVPYFLIGLVQMAFLFGVGAVAFGLTVAGSIPALAVLTVAVVFAAVSLGLLIASFGGSEKQVGSVGSIMLLVMGLMGGAMVPRITMPETMRELGLATPHAWALDGYYDLLMRTGSGFADVWLPILGVTAFGVVFAAIGAMRFRFER